jgi:hypothetical protein
MYILYIYIFIRWISDMFFCHIRQTIKSSNQCSAVVLGSSIGFSWIQLMLLVILLCGGLIWRPMEWYFADLLMLLYRWSNTKQRHTERDWYWYYTYQSFVAVSFVRKLYSSNACAYKCQFVSIWALLGPLWAHRWPVLRPFGPIHGPMLGPSWAHGCAL